jgi:hypothetical protein
MKQTSDIKIEQAAEGEYPPGEEWRGKLREAVELLGNLYDDQWVKVYPIEPEIVNRVRSAAHFYMSQWEQRHRYDENEPYKLMTRYVSSTKTFWMATQPIEKEKGGNEEDD